MITTAVLGDFESDIASQPWQEFPASGGADDWSSGSSGGGFDWGKFATGAMSAVGSYLSSSRKTTSPSGSQTTIYYGSTPQGSQPALTYYMPPATSSGVSATTLLLVGGALVVGLVGVGVLKSVLKK